MFSLAPAISAEESDPWWNPDYSYRQKIVLPIDTSKKTAEYQPIDIFIEFENPCWAKDTYEHSIRVIYQKGNILKEIESQIYDLNVTNSTFISSCGLVFLIPEQADGKETYYVYYDGSSKPEPKYTDHVDVDESYYIYEPVQGYSAESWYYKIVDDQDIEYAIGYKGTAFDEYVAHQITKLKKGTKQVMPNQGEVVASFNTVYYWRTGDEWKHISSSEKLVSKKIFTDGNLMTKIGVVTESNNGLLRSRVIYKYYHSPSDENGVYTDVKHEIEGSPLPKGDEIDLSYSILHYGRFKSSTIKDLNYGKIPAFIHFYSEEERIISYDIDQYPDVVDWELLIKKKDDYDLGSNPWVSMGEGESGKAHGIIYDSNSPMNSGKNERDGIELQFTVSKFIQLPGLDGTFAYLYLMRNAFEENEPSDDSLPEDLVISYKSQFFSTEDGGYKSVQDESILYRSLIDYQPDDDGVVVDGDNDLESYNLTVYSHLKPAVFSKFLGASLFFKYPYISIDIYQNDSLIAHSRASRISFVDNYSLDWKNASLFKKSRFKFLSPGTYIVKIYLENSLFEEKEFIGYDIVDLKDDTSLRVYCNIEGEIKINFVDQKNKGIKNVETHLIKDGFVLRKVISNTEGSVIVGAPCDLFEEYNLKSYYKGFLIDERNISINFLNDIFLSKEDVEVNLYNLEVNVKDETGGIPSFDVDLSLNSYQMSKLIDLQPDDYSNGSYVFENIISGRYNLTIEYGNVEVVESIDIEESLNFDITLYNLILNIVDNWNLSPDIQLETLLIYKDAEKEFTIYGEKNSNDNIIFKNLYPGDYELFISYRADTISKIITIPKEDFTILFPINFNLTLDLYDSYGNPLTNADVLLSRGNKTINNTTNANGNVIFSVPPGFYNVKVRSNGKVVAKRDVKVLNDKQLSSTTIKQPFYLSISSLLFLVFIIISAIISYKKRDKILFLKLFCLSFALLSIVFPWWQLSGSSELVDTSTNLYLAPSEMVTITDYKNVTAGELGTLESQFNSVIDLIPLIIITGAVFILLSIFLKKLKKQKFSSISYLSGLALFLTSFSVFIYAMSLLSNIIVGGFIGAGDIDISIPGEEMYLTVSSSWGPTIGFYIFLTSLIVLIIPGLIMFKNWYKKIKKC